MATASNIATITSRARPRKIARDRGKLIARAAIVTGALVAAGVFLPAALSSWAEVDHPRLATRIAPWNAQAAADAAALDSNPRSRRVRDLVARALARDLTQVPAIELRALDLAMSGRKDDARRLFELSDRLSRRSLPTRLWLIQDAVDHGDVRGALRNFDIALRTSTDAQPILFPILAKASGDRTLTGQLAATFDRPSDWRLVFFEWALTTGADVRPLALVVETMHDKRFLLANAIDQRLIEQMVSAGEFGEARRLNARFRPQPETVADPHFADASARYPFGWGLVDGGSLGAQRSLTGSSPALTYNAAPARSGQVAAQLLALRPGRYALGTETATRVTGAAPYWSVSCAATGGAEIARLDQPSTASARAQTMFSVPATCGAQWLTLRIRPAPDSSSQSGVIAWVTISAR